MSSDKYPPSPRSEELDEALALLLGWEPVLVLSNLYRYKRLKTTSDPHFTLDAVANGVLIGITHMWAVDLRTAVAYDTK